ncbi:hypothetical protein LLH03_05210 [bacterium]|nr:hypothetical protein [bacterium]
MKRLALLLCVAAVTLAAHADQSVSHKPISVYLEGELVHYYSQLLDPSTPITAGMVVDGKPMVSQRFLSDRLHVPSETYLLKRWGVFKLGEYAFKLGSNLVIREVAMFGGGAWTERAMPLPPLILRDGECERLYVPAIPVLGTLGHATEWKPTEKALYLRTGQATPQERSFLY